MPLETPGDRGRRNLPLSTVQRSLAELRYPALGTSQNIIISTKTSVCIVPSRQHWYVSSAETSLRSMYPRRISDMTRKKQKPNVACRNRKSTEWYLKAYDDTAKLLSKYHLVKKVPKRRSPKRIVVGSSIPECRIPEVKVFSKMQRGQRHDNNQAHENTASATKPVGVVPQPAPWTPPSVAHTEKSVPIVYPCKFKMFNILKDLENELYRLIELPKIKNFLDKHSVRPKTCECWHFMIGRTTCRIKKDWNTAFVIDGKKVNGYTNDPMTGSKSVWMKELYSRHLLPMAKAVDFEWVGPDDDVCFQVNILRGESMRVNRHVDDRDVSYQYGVGLGDYEGGTLRTYNSKKQEMCELSIKGKVVKLDGRFPHEALPVTRGTRFSIYIFKTFDRRWDKSKPMMWPPEVLADLHCDGSLGKVATQTYEP